jgi:hypothetical protein
MWMGPHHATIILGSDNNIDPIPLLQGFQLQQIVRRDILDPTHRYLEVGLRKAVGVLGLNWLF